MIERRNLLSRVNRALERAPVTGLMGPRQCGKTTLARQVAGSRARVEYFDLEAPKDVARLENPELALARLKGLVVIDEIQLMPSLFPLLRVLADRRPLPARFLILGSVSPDLVAGASESLAGRIEFIEMGGIEPADPGSPSLDRLWVRGGLPRSCLARTEKDSYTWRENYVLTFLERDVPKLGIRIPAAALRRFWSMLAHYHGQTWNSCEIAGAMAMSDKTMRQYLDILSGAFLVRQLHPWFENVGKRQVKAPKIYFRDTGLLHLLLEIPDLRALDRHPKIGASWEGFALELTLRSLRPLSAYYWGTHAGAELDLMIVDRGLRYGFEFKRADAPRMTRSLQSAIDSLGLEKAWIVYPGRIAYRINEKVSVLPLDRLAGRVSLAKL
jgi:predicted AAA+ superfamily ATPase